MQDPDSILNFIQSRIPNFTSIEHASSLESGLNNQIWRLSDGRISVVLKNALPRIEDTFDPDHPDLIEFEARALRLFEDDTLLKNLVSNLIRPVRCLGLLKEERCLLLEDLGDGPDLATWLLRSASAMGFDAAADLLGTFIGRMHSVTAGNGRLAKRFNNRTVQERRYRDLYNEVGPSMRKAGYPGWEEVDTKAQKLGLRFMDTGVCLTMGDLRPQSIVMVPRGVRLIDWEFCHYGFPAQDVARLSAHLWMHAHVEADLDVRRRLRAFNSKFLSTYQKIIRSEAPRLFEADDFYDTHNVHFGCEILNRTTGVMMKDYLYDGPRRREQKKDAVTVATNCITGDAPVFLRS